MGNIIVGLVTIGVGAALIIFRRSFVELSVGYQIWAFRMPFGKRIVKIGYVVVPIFGLIVVLLGILILLGVFRVK